MAAVLHLVGKTNNQETVDAMRYLLSLALEGKCKASMNTYRDENGEEQTLLTGAYKDHPEAAVMATLRLTAAMLRAETE